MPKKRLSTIAKEIQKYSETITAGVVEIGRCLCEVKSRLPHGEFLPWLKENTTLSQPTANRYMRMYKEYAELIKEHPTIGNISYSKMFLLLALPHPARGEIIKAYDLQAMSVREVKTLVDEATKYSPTDAALFKKIGNDDVLFLIDAHAAAFVDNYKVITSSFEKLISQLEQIVDTSLSDKLREQTIEMLSLYHYRLAKTVERSK